MFKSYSIHVLVLALAASAMADESYMEHVNVYAWGEDEYNVYRIPSIEIAPDGTLLAFAEGRKQGGQDPGLNKEQDVDLVLKRSTDGGETWSAMTIVEDPGQYWSAANAATLVDRDTGKVWIFYIRSKPGRSTESARPGTDDMQTLARWSADYGETWSEPIDLTAVARNMDDPAWRASVPGPGGAIQTRSGRFIVPVWKEPYNVFAIYSDDHGATWQRGEFVPGGERGNESQLVELADGRVLLDARQTGGPRWRTISSDGGQTWSKTFDGLKLARCASAVERWTLESAGDDRNRILFTGPKGPGRKTLMACVSYDEGKTFPTERIISEDDCAYSDLIVLPNKMAGCLWERGGGFITLTRFNMAWLETEE